MIGLKLVDSIDKIEKDIRQALVVDLNTLLAKKKGAVVEKLKVNIRSWILAEPELDSLQSSSTPYSLSSVFGIQRGSEVGIAQAIASAVANSIQVNFSKIDKNFRGGITFNIQPADFQNLLGLPQGHVTTAKGTDLHWLNWLLLEGDSVVVAGYQYDATGKGRSGSGRMVSGNSFRVPPAFSGTATNNFVTRAFVNKQKEIERIISEVFK